MLVILYCNQIFLFEILHQLQTYFLKNIHKETHFCRFLFLEISHKQSTYLQLANAICFAQTRTIRVLFFMSQLVNVQINLQRFSADFTVRRSSEGECRTQKNNYRSTQHTKLTFRMATFWRQLDNCFLPGLKIALVSSNKCLFLNSSFLKQNGH